MSKYKILARRGMDEWEVDCESVRVDWDRDGWFDIRPEDSGSVSLIARERINIQPVGASSVRVGFKDGGGGDE